MNNLALQEAKKVVDEFLKAEISAKWLNFNSMKLSQGIFKTIVQKLQGIKADKDNSNSRKKMFGIRFSNNKGITTIPIEARAFARAEIKGDIDLRGVSI
ncbi:MAG: hypothetical protein ACI9CD_000291 [Candidatus Deianiraeaceae bacterium]|jgi:hypothetical protein